MPNTKTLKPALVAITKRGISTENMHMGWICVINNRKKVIYKKGNIQDKVFLRSSAKPIQAIPIVDNNIQITPKELALACASHSGSKKHLSVLQSFIKNHKLKLSEIKCGIHFPFDDLERKKLIKSGKSPNQLHNNCSGKHLGMLAVCKKNKWDTKTYLSPKHPIQKIILRNLQRLSETKNIDIAIDGCGAPTFSLPVVNIARLFSNFTSSKNSKYKKIISSMTKNPIYAGSKNQIDTEIMKASKGNLLAKAGAEGIIIVAYEGNCAVVKIADGSQPTRSFITLRLLVKLGWLKKEEIKNTPLEEIYKGQIKNHVGKVIGKLIPC